MKPVALRGLSYGNGHVRKPPVSAARPGLAIARWTDFDRVAGHLGIPFAGLGSSIFCEKVGEADWGIRLLGEDFQELWVRGAWQRKELI